MRISGRIVAACQWRTKFLCTDPTISRPRPAHGSVHVCARVQQTQLTRVRRRVIDTCTHIMNMMCTNVCTACVRAFVRTHACMCKLRTHTHTHHTGYTASITAHTLHCYRFRQTLLGPIQHLHRQGKRERGGGLREGGEESWRPGALDILLVCVLL
jgi:hypothetical protein